jgi:hypothetical protein
MLLGGGMTDIPEAEGSTVGQRVLGEDLGCDGREGAEEGGSPIQPIAMPCW